MKDTLEERVKRLRLMGESAKRRSNLYSGISGLDDKNTAKSLGSLNRASAPGKKMQKLGFIMLWVPEPTGVTCAVGGPMILAGRYLDKVYNGAKISDVHSHTKDSFSTIHDFKDSVM